MPVPPFVSQNGQLRGLDHLPNNPKEVSRSCPSSVLIGRRPQSTAERAGPRFKNLVFNLTERAIFAIQVNLLTPGPVTEQMTCATDPQEQNNEKSVILPQILTDL
jgi:hypothetical protein